MNQLSVRNNYNLMRKALPIAVLLACAFFLYCYVRDHIADFDQIQGISPPFAILVGVGYLLSLAVNGLCLRVLTLGFRIDLKFAEHFSISVVTSFGNMFLPMKGGAGFRAVYLKERYDFDYSYFVSSLAGSYLTSFSIYSLTALAGLVALQSKTGGFNIPAAAVFLAIFAATSRAIFFPPATLSFIPFQWVRERANQVLLGWQIMRKSPKTVRDICGLTALHLLLTSFITWLEFAAFGMKDVNGGDIGLFQSILFTAVGTISFLLSITPAGLGIRESVLMVSSDLLGITPAQALAVSLLDRAINFIVLALLFGFASVYLKNRLHMKSPAPVRDLKTKSAEE